MVHASRVPSRPLASPACLHGRTHRRPALSAICRKRSAAVLTPPSLASRRQAMAMAAAACACCAAAALSAVAASSSHRTRSPVVVASVVAAPPSPNHEPTQRRAGPNGGIGRGAGGGGSGAVLRTVIRRGDVLERPRIHSTDVEGTSPPAAEQAAGRAHWWARIGRATERKAEEGGHRGRGAYLPSEEESAPP